MSCCYDKASAHGLKALIVWANLCRVNALECMAALVVTSKGQLSEKVELLFSLFDLSETNLITYDEMVILATSVLAGMVKITGKGNLPEDANMEKLVDQAFLDVSDCWRGLCALVMGSLSDLGMYVSLSVVPSSPVSLTGRAG